MTDDEKKKDKFPPPGPAPKPKENLNFPSRGCGGVVLSNGMSMEEIASDPELLEEYAEAQSRLYVQRVRNLEKNQADRIQREQDKISGVPFNSMQEVLDDLKARREASESDE